MTRKEITVFLGRLLEQQKFSGFGKYWAKEVSLDYGSVNVRRVDYMQFEPENQVHVSGIEKGIFICYEIKSCKEDFKSGFGQNYIGEKNYLVMPMQTYKDVIHDIPNDIGVLVPIPEYGEKAQEFENPTALTSNPEDWKLVAIRAARQKTRERSMIELLFCMLRSTKKHQLYSNERNTNDI